MLLSQFSRSLWTPHLTRRILSLIYTHLRGSSCVFVVRTSCVILMCLFWLSSTTPLSSLSADHLLSCHPVPSSCPSNFIFQDVVDKFPVHSRWWGPWHPCPSTTLSQAMIPKTTTSRRLLNPTSSNPRLRMGPRMTSSTMTPQSARRSLHHCSPESEKMMRAVDEGFVVQSVVVRQSW